MPGKKASSGATTHEEATFFRESRRSLCRLAKCLYGGQVQSAGTRREPLRGLYPLIDADACEARSLDLIQCAWAILDASPPIVQLRAKDRPIGMVCEWAEKIVERLRGCETKFIINDRADIARAVGADGVHVGQGDLPAAELAHHYPDLKVGLSTHDEQQLEIALQSSALDYVALGPVFPTRSKKNPEPPLSIGRLQKGWSMARERAIPLVAIGGITPATLVEVSQACDLVATIAMVLSENNGEGVYTRITERVASLDRVVKGAGR